MIELSIAIAAIVAAAGAVAWAWRAGSRSGEVERAARAEVEKETKARHEAKEVTDATLRLGEAQAVACLETAAALVRVRAAPLGSDLRADLVR